MKRIWEAVRDAWNETLTRWGQGSYMTLDCMDGNHAACDTCRCSCHDGDHR